jgi:ABC-type tungstate transport system substrate-binding protein
MTKRDPLLDIAPATETVPGFPLPVTGMSLHAVAEVMRRHNVLAELFSGGTVDAARMLAKAPDTVVAVIAAAVGRPADEVAEQAIAKLPLGTQTRLLDRAVALTFPEGLAPFRDRLVQLASSLTIAPVAGDGAAAG